MRYWLVKSEPSVWSWDMQVKAGGKGTRWDGVRNHLAKQNLMAMRLGDKGFFYHSNEGKNIVGIVEIVREHYPDPTAPGELRSSSDLSAGALAKAEAVAHKNPWVVVDVAARSPLPMPVSLAQVKADPALQKMSLVTSARLSVQPVTAAEWKRICRMGGISA